MPMLSCHLVRIKSVLQIKTKLGIDALNPILPYKSKFRLVCKGLKSFVVLAAMVFPNKIFGDGSNGQQVIVSEISHASSYGILEGTDLIGGNNNAIDYDRPLNSKSISLPENLTFDEDGGFSFATWFVVDRLKDAVGIRQVILDTRSSENNNGFYIFIDPERSYSVRAGAKGSSNSAQYLQTIDGYADGVWHHVLLTVSAKKIMRLKVDGHTAYGEDGITGQILLHSTQYGNSTINSIGGSAVDSNEFGNLIGSVDEAWYWNYELPDEMIEDIICNPIKERAVPIKNKSIRLGAYVWKGNISCYAEWLGKSFDVISSRFDGSKKYIRFRDRLRESNNNILLFRQFNAVYWPKRKKHMFTGSAVSIEGANLERPLKHQSSKYTSDVVSKSSSQGYSYDPGHPLFVEEWINYITKYYITNSKRDNLGMDGVVVDNLPMGGADLWKTKKSGRLDYSLNKGMQAKDGRGVIYDGSFERRLQGTERFIREVNKQLIKHEQDGVNDKRALIAVNLSSHSKTVSSSARILQARFNAGWFETWLTKYVSRTPKNAKNQLRRKRDFELAEQKSHDGIPLILGYAYDFMVKDDVESMIATYLVAKRGEGMKLHPMPINILRQDLIRNKGYFLSNDYKSITAPATWGYSANYLFEGLQKYRQYYEIDMGVALDDKLEISEYSYLRKYENGIALVNIGDSRVTVSTSVLEEMEVDIDLYKTIDGSTIKMPIILNSMNGKVLRLQGANH